MYTLDYPWLLLLIVLPLVLRYVLPSYRVSRKAIRVPWFQRIAKLIGQQPNLGAAVAKASVFHRFFSLLLWAIIVIAIATRP